MIKVDGIVSRREADGATNRGRASKVEITAGIPRVLIHGLSIQVAGIARRLIIGASIRILGADSR